MVSDSLGNQTALVITYVFDSLKEPDYTVHMKELNRKTLNLN